MDIFGKFKQLVKIREVLVDNEVFQLHYRVTAVLLLGCGALVASKQHFGDPIDCITRDDVPNKIMDTYCWIHSTFTLPEACNKTVGIEVAHPCVDSSNHQREDRIYHKYYQWVYFVLFFQAVCFYAPHFIWKSWESKLLTKLTVDFRDPLHRVDEELNGKFRNVVRYMARESNKARHRTYYYYFTICEVMNFLNVIMQIYLVDAFLGGTFTTYGLDVINYAQLEQDDRADPMVRVFPRMTKCTFHRFGASGDIQRYDALCILPLNIINEKIYIVMWFWFVFLALVTGLWLVYRLLTFFKPNIRYQVIRRRATMARGESIAHVLEHLEPGDWFLLSMMCKNMDTQWFRMLINRLSKTIELRERESIAKGYRPNDGPRVSRNGRGPLLKRDEEISDVEDEEEEDEDGDAQLEVGRPPNKGTDDEAALEEVAVKT